MAFHNVADGKHSPPIKTMNISGQPKLVWDQVHEMRKHFLQHPTTPMRHYCEKYGVSYSTIFQVMDNTSWKQDDYEPPPKASRKGTEPRMAAFEYPFHCRICGMGHDLPIEASDCCKRLEEHEYPPIPCKPKYGATKGETEGKYERNKPRDWGNW